MAKIAYILLCHKDPEAVIAQAGMLTAVGDCVSIHFDGRADGQDFERIEAGLADPNVCFARRRVRCGWGEWSLVQATLEALEAAVRAFPWATHSTCCRATVPRSSRRAMRVGLVGENTSADTLARMLPTIRLETTCESDNIRDAAFEHHTIMRETARDSDNATAIAQFLGIGQAQALDIARGDHLFAD